MDKITAAKYCDDLEALAWSDTFYKNVYPYNCLYCYGNGRFSADCNNLIKSLVNGREIKDAKAYSYQNSFEITGDVNEYRLLQLCKDVTSDFSQLLKKRVPHVLYMSGHVGTYLGYEVTIEGNTYNTVECTAWSGDVGHDGVIYSYCDSLGYRRYHKGGTAKSRWTHNGSMTSLIDCSVISDKAKAWSAGRELTYQENWMVESFVNDSRHVIQRGKSNQYEDVVFLQSYLAYFGYYKGDLDGDYGQMSEAAAIEWQGKNNLYQDGIIGAKSWGVIRLGKG